MDFNRIYGEIGCSRKNECVDGTEDGELGHWCSVMFTEQEQEEAGGETVLILEVYIPECRTISFARKFLHFGYRKPREWLERLSTSSDVQSLEN